MAGEISRLLFAPVSSASRSLTPTRNDATSTKTSNEEREKKRGGKKKKNKEKYTSVEKRARETDSAASSVITINCSPRDNYRYPWNGRRGDMPRVRVSLRCSPTVRFFRPSPPSLPGAFFDDDESITRPLTGAKDGSSNGAISPQSGETKAKRERV